MKLETIAVHAGKKPDAGTGAITSSIQLATTFERGIDGSFPHGYIYARSNNPNRKGLETCLAALEGGACAAAFASGSAASMAVFQALSPGDHIIAPLDIYWGTTIQLREILERWGLKVSTVDMSDARQVEDAMTPKTRLLWVETPSNPLLKIVDIERMVSIGHSAGVIVACDNTWGTPVLQRPLEMGVDVVMHSTTKYLGGHSDVISGALISKEENDFFRKMRVIQTSGGAVPSPFDCWLIQRGVSTLAWRVRAQSEQALRVAEFLERHSKVAAVHYPGLPGHQNHEIAKRQMTGGFGGMIGLDLGTLDAGKTFANSVRLCTLATSLGGVETILQHSASMTHATLSPEERLKAGVTDGMIRLSVGIEDVNDLLADIEQALDQI